jgi:hypothetical protein
MLYYQHILLQLVLFFFLVASTTLAAEVQREDSTGTTVWGVVPLGGSGGGYYDNNNNNNVGDNVGGGGFLDWCDNDNDCDNDERCEYNYCVYDTFGNNNNANGDRGDYCDDWDDCDDGDDDLICWDRRCIREDNIGDDCNDNDDCDNDDLWCYQDRCIPDGSNINGNLGDFCFNSGDCDGGLWCDWNTCVRCECFSILPHHFCGRERERAESGERSFPSFITFTRHHHLFFDAHHSPQTCSLVFIFLQQTAVAMPMAMATWAITARRATIATWVCAVDARLVCATVVRSMADPATFVATRAIAMTI